MRPAPVIELKNDFCVVLLDSQEKLKVISGKTEYEEDICVIKLGVVFPATVYNSVGVVAAPMKILTGLT